MPEPVIDRTWPITVATMRKALGYEADQGDDLELALFAQAACERIDARTGRDVEPTRHNLADEKPPIIFILSARETAKLWWQQSKNGPRGNVTDPGAQVQGPPMGAELPRKVEGWLSPFRPPPGFGQTLPVVP